MKMRNDYLEALGIPDFLFAKSDLVNKNLSLAECLIIETSNKESFCIEGETQSLLIKMLASINLDLSNVSLLSVEKYMIDASIKANPAKSVLIMDSNFNSTSTSTFQFVSYHPREVLKDTNLKREVWEILKKINQCLK